VSGTAAIGLPLAGATVNIKDATGKEITTTTDANGNYVFYVIAGSAPFLLKANGTVNGQQFTYYSLAKGGGTTNVNPLTHLALVSAAGMQDLGALYSGDNAAIAAAAGKLDAAIETVQTALKPLFVAYGIEKVNPMSDPSPANNQGLDRVLDAITIDYTGDAVTITNSRNDAVFFSAPSATALAHGTLTTVNVPQPIAGTGKWVLKNGTYNNTSDTVTPMPEAMSYRYDAIGQLVMVALSNPDPAGYHYDYAVTYDDGTVSDDTDAITTDAYEYDSAGRVIRQTTTYGDPYPGTKIVVTRYDAFGRISLRTTTTDSWVTSDSYIYADDGSYTVSTNDSKSGLTALDEYTAAGNKVRSTSAVPRPDGTATTTLSDMVYDAAGNLVSYTSTHRLIENGVVTFEDVVKVASRWVYI
jgi:YD repeat-containing protein